MNRCPWAQSELAILYHDQEWGLPCHDDQTLFEFLVLEGAQAGLSWETILRKRDRYRQVFDQFDPKVIAQYDDNKVAELLNDPGIIRNRRKVHSAVVNARIFLDIQDQYGSFNSFIWQYVGGEPICNQFTSLHQIPAETDLSRKISRDLKKMGMSFVGPTIIYAFMQAVGMVNDHLVNCFRYQQVNEKH